MPIRGSQVTVQGLVIVAAALGLGDLVPIVAATGQPMDKLVQFGQESEMGRAGQPAELAGAYVFLASEAASYISGETLAVTGGALTP